MGSGQLMKQAPLSGFIDVTVEKSDLDLHDPSVSNQHRCYTDLSRFLQIGRRFFSQFLPVKNPNLVA